jgi:hypothetical protein
VQGEALLRDMKAKTQIEIPLGDVVVRLAEIFEKG